MANPTTNYSWQMPTSTDLVTDLPADFEVFGQAVDNTMATMVAKTIVDAKGDIIAATAADTVSRLAVGANDTVLMADSTAATGLKWGTVSSGGMTLLSTTTLSGSTTTISSISGSYKDLAILVESVTLSSAGNVRFLPNGTNPQGVANIYDNNGPGELTANSTGYLTGTNSKTLQSGSGALANWAILLKNYTDTVSYKPVQWYGGFVNGGYIMVQAAGYASTSSAITSINFTTSNTFSGGTVRIYGVS